MAPKPTQLPELPYEIYTTILQQADDLYGQDLKSFSLACRAFQDLALHAQLKHGMLILDVKERRSRRESFVSRVLSAPEGLRSQVRKLYIQGYVEALDPVDEHAKVEHIRRAETYDGIFLSLLAVLPNLEELRFDDILFHPHLARRLSQQVPHFCPKLERLIMNCVQGKMAGLRLPGLKSLTWLNSLAPPPISLLWSSASTLEELNIDYQTPPDANAHDMLQFSDIRFPRLRKLAMFPALISLEKAGIDFEDIFGHRMGKGWETDDWEDLGDVRFPVGEVEDGVDMDFQAELHAAAGEPETEFALANDVTQKMTTFLGHHPTITSLSYGDQTTLLNTLAQLAEPSVEHSANGAFLPHLEELEINYANALQFYDGWPAVFNRLTSLKIWLYESDAEYDLVQVVEALQPELHAARVVTFARAEEVHRGPCVLGHGAAVNLFQAMTALKRGHDGSVPSVRYHDVVPFEKSTGDQAHDHVLRLLKTFS